MNGCVILITVHLAFSRNMKSDQLLTHDYTKVLPTKSASLKIVNSAALTLKGEILVKLTRWSKPGTPPIHQHLTLEYASLHVDKPENSVTEIQIQTSALSSVVKRVVHTRNNIKHVRWHVTIVRLCTWYLWSELASYPGHGRMGEMAFYLLHAYVLTTSAKAGTLNMTVYFRIYLQYTSVNYSVLKGKSVRIDSCICFLLT